MNTSISDWKLSETFLVAVLWKPFQFFRSILNLLKPTGYVMYQQVNIEQLCNKLQLEGRQTQLIFEVYKQLIT